MEIKPIVYTDLLPIVPEYIHYFNTYEEAEWNDERVLRKFKQLVNRFDYMGLGLFVEGTIKGFAVGSLVQFDDGIISLLNELFVSHNMQNKGYGTKLLKAFESYSKEKGAFRIQLESANDDIHHRFYNKQNYYQDANNNILKAKAL